MPRRQSNWRITSWVKSVFCRRFTIMSLLPCSRWIDEVGSKVHNDVSLTAFMFTLNWQSRRPIKFIENSKDIQITIDSINSVIFSILSPKPSSLAAPSWSSSVTFDIVRLLSHRSVGVVLILSLQIPIKLCWPGKPDKPSIWSICCRSCRLTWCCRSHHHWTSLHNKILVVWSEDITSPVLCVLSWIDVWRWHILTFVRATPKPASSMAHSTVTRALALWAHT